MSNTYYTKWSWNELNQYSQSTLEEISKAYNAIINNGLCSDFGYVVWNDIVRLVNETMNLSGYGWQTNNRYSDEVVISYEEALMSEDDKTLTASRFNAVRFQMDRFKEWFWEYDEAATGYVGRKSFLGTTDVGADEADKVYGVYFLVLTTAINEMINELEKYMMHGSIELDFNAVGILVNGESRLCEAYIKLCETTDVRLDVDLPAPLGDENIYNIMLNLFPNLNASPSNGLTAYLNEISQSVELNADKSIDSAYMEDLHLLEEIVANVDDSIDATYKRYLGLIDSSKPEVNPSVDSTYAVDYSPTVDVKSEVLPSMDSAYKQSLAFCDSAYLIVQTIRMCIYKARLDLHITSIADVTPTKEMQYSEPLNLEVIRNLTVHLAVHLVRMYEINMKINALLDIDLSIEQSRELKIPFDDKVISSVEDTVTNYYCKNIKSDVGADLENGEPNSSIIAENIKNYFEVILNNDEPQNMGSNIDLGLSNSVISNNGLPQELYKNQNIVLTTVFSLLLGVSNSIEKTLHNIAMQSKAMLSAYNIQSSSIASYKENISPKLTTDLKVWLMPIKTGNVLKIRQGHTINKINNKLYIE